MTLYTDKQDYASLIKLYEQALKVRQRTDSELPTVLEIGRLYFHKLKNFEQANEYYQRVRKVDPAHQEMLDFYRSYHGGRGTGKPTADDSSKLLAVLTQAQKVENDAGRRLSLGIEMAQVAESSPGGLDKAIDIWKSVLKLQSGHGEASAALKRLYTRTEGGTRCLRCSRSSGGGAVQGRSGAARAENRALVGGRGDLSRSAEARRDGDQHLQRDLGARRSTSARSLMHSVRNTRRWRAETT